MGARIGIDLGTTNSAAAGVYDDGAHIIPRHDSSEALTPSVVFFRWRTGPEDVLVGRDADQQHGRVVRSVKRLMGRTYSDAVREGALHHFPDGDVALVRDAGDDLRIRVADGSGTSAQFWPHEVSASILRHLRDRAEQGLGTAIEGTVITVPAYFQDPHRQATLEAARLAGLQVIEPLLDEPTAAALAYSQVVGVAPADPLLVVDWGGGTLDVTVILNDGKEWVQLAIDGDLNLGGDDVDRVLVEWLLNRQRIPLSLLNDPVALHKLMATARTAKHRLSASPEGSVACGGLLHPDTGKPLMIAETITREDFDACVEPLIGRVMSRVEAAVSHPDVPRTAIRNILLVGGSTRIPALRRRLAAIPDATLRDEMDPMTAVAVGAALYAASQRPDVFRLCPYGYAVEADGEMLEVVPPGQEVPTPQTLPFKITPPPRTRYDGQTVFRLTLHRFTRHDAIFRSLSIHGGARIFGRGLPPRPAGTPVDMELWLDENKVLHARVHAEGGALPIEATVSMTEIGAEAIRTQLQDRMLEGAAILEANRNTSTPLTSALGAAVAEAESSVAGVEIDRGRLAAALPPLEDLLNQIASAHAAGSPTSDERAVKDRVLEWVAFYEQELLPASWDLLELAQRDQAVRDIRRIRIMNETGARADEMWAALGRLRDNLEAGPTGAILAAQTRLGTQGVSTRARQELARLIGAAIDHWRSGDKAALEQTVEVLRQVTRQAEADLAAWQQSLGVQRGDPTLLMTRGLQK